MSTGGEVLKTTTSLDLAEQGVARCCKPVGQTAAVFAGDEGARKTVGRARHLLEADRSTTLTRRLKACHFNERSPDSTPSHQRGGRTGTVPHAPVARSPAPTIG